MGERVVVDVWIDFGDPWSALGLERLVRGADADVAIDVHSFPADSTIFSPDDAERFARVAANEGLVVAPECLTRERNTELRDWAHRAMSVVKFAVDYKVPRVPPIPRQAVAETYFALAKMHGWEDEPYALATPGSVEARIAEYVARAKLAAARQMQAVLMRADARVEDLAEASRVEPEAVDRGNPDLAVHVDRTIAEDVENAKRLRISGLPLVVIAGRIMVVGAQKPEVYTRLIAEAREAIREAEKSPDRPRPTSFPPSSPPLLPPL